MVHSTAHSMRGRGFQRRHLYLATLRWVLARFLLVSNTAALAAVFEESFDRDPATHGWIARGDATLFQWNAAAQALDVTWDSTRPNSFFALPLMMHLGRRDDFEVAFDLVLHEHRVGADPAKPGTFQISAGFLNLADATAPTFVRASGVASPNLVEWAWFGADTTISASVSPVITSTNRPPRWAFRDSYVELENGKVYRFNLRYTAADSTMRLGMWVNGVAGPTLDPVVLPATFTDFDVDAFAVSSYSDAGQDPRYAGSVRARGTIDNVRLVQPDPPVQGLSLVSVDGVRGVRFGSAKGWGYVLEGSQDLVNWAPVGSTGAGTGGAMELLDFREALFGRMFYRVRADRE